LIIATEFEYLKLLSNEEKFNWNYSETAYTFLIYHTKIDNHCARQFFLEDGPLAFLPISNTTTSVVWSVQNKSKAEKIIHNVKDRLNFLRNISSNFYQINTCSKDLDYFPLTFEFLKKTVLSRTIFLGDITHKIHPIAGQGWNMTLRDIDILVKDLKDNINKGYDIGDINLLREFEKKPKLAIYYLRSQSILLENHLELNPPPFLLCEKKVFLWHHNQRL
jgi:2-polyprenyl-6-methoxyphenol hydroxylase and related FAD-dependent oxidoreductases